MSDFELRRALRQLPSERSPTQDLWPGIASRLSATQQDSVAAPAPSRAWRWPAMAAAALLAGGLATVLWQAPGPEVVPVVATVPRPAAATDAVRPPGAARTVAPSRRDVLLVQADALTLEYVSALDQIGGSAVPPELPAGLSPALAELDRSATDIRAALRDAPSSGFLLGQLRRTYSQRLRLTQEAMAG